MSACHYFALDTLAQIVYFFDSWGEESRFCLVLRPPVVKIYDLSFALDPLFKNSELTKHRHYFQLFS